MRIIARRTLREFWETHPDSEHALRSWFHEAVSSEWTGSAWVKAHYPTASLLHDNRVIFNICGNKYRLVVRVRYDHGAVYIRFIGTHAECDRIEAESV